MVFTSILLLFFYVFQEPSADFIPTGDLTNLAGSFSNHGDAFLPLNAGDLQSPGKSSHVEYSIPDSNHILE